MLKPDPSRYPRLIYTRISSGPEPVEPDSADHGEGSNGASASGPQEVSAEPALDLRLNQILEQARLATAATGAVIALAHGGEMVCRATSGGKAPSLGIGLNTRSGLSGACVQTREMQRCDDTLTDLRVNAIACRDLDIRSILVLPVLDGEKLWGIFEVFSSAPRAFSDPDVQALEALSRRIAHTVHEAYEGGTWAQAADTPPQRPRADPAQPEVMAREISLASEKRDLRIRGRDYRTGALTVAVIALAILLGWMVGRAGWSMAVNRAQTQLPIAPEEAKASEQEPADTLRASPDMKEPTSSAKPVRVTPAQSALSKPATKSKAVLLPGGLVVYEHGKVVFQMAPSEKTLLSGSEKTLIEPQSSVQSAVTQEGDSSPAAQTALRAPNSYLLERVEPEYPEEAKQQHIQGPVVLNAFVGTDGSVRELKVISGDPQLTKAAVDAVSQWHFQPHRLKGQLVEFETQITVNFALP